MKTVPTVLPLSAVAAALFLIGVVGIVHAQVGATSPRSRALKRMPPPARVRPLQLQKPFTLIYQAKTSWGIAGKLKPGSLRLTISYDGKDLLFREEDRERKVTRTVLYTDNETYTSDSNSLIAQIDAGFDFKRMPYCPLPGVGLPYAPLLFDGVPDAAMAKFIPSIAPKQATEAKYVAPALYKTPGIARDYGVFLDTDYAAAHHYHSGRAASASVVSVSAPGVSKVIWYDTFDNPTDNLGRLWEYFDHRNFQGLWLATEIRMREWVVFQGSPRSELIRDARYYLESATDGPLKPGAYDPTTYLPNHANITDFTGPVSRSFVYYRDKGSLQEQRGTASHVQSAKPQNSRGPATPWLFGLMPVPILAAVGVAWGRRASEPKA